jgi:ABC-2 type transport system ATP-binding protein
MAFIEIKEVTKEYSVLKRRPGLRGAIADLVAAKRETIRAVSNVSFEIGKGRRSQLPRPSCAR